MHYLQERRAVILIITVLALLAICSYCIESTEKSRFATPFSGSLEDGTLAVLTGTITAATNTRTGGHLMLTVDNTTVFVPDGALEDPKKTIGDYVHVIGTVQTYHGKKEIIVASPNDMAVQT